MSDAVTPNEADKKASDFVTLAAHQLKTPIAELKGYVENLLAGTAGPVNEQQAHYLEQKHHVCQRSSHLIDNLLDISQIELGIVTMALTPTDLQALVEHVLGGFEHDIRAKGLSLTLDQAGSEVVIFADPFRTSEVLKNLIHNAVKF